MQTQVSFVFDFYSIVLNRNFKGRTKYGQQASDFDGGVLFFMSPGQVFSVDIDPGATEQRSGYVLLIHPDFLWNTSLAKTIKKYEYFDYSVNEALHPSTKEEKKIINIIKSIQQEYHENIDTFSQDIIIAQLEVLLNYSERFYQRQFITRKKSNHTILDRLEDLLTDYFNGESLSKNGLPTVEYISEKLSISPSYLRGLLKTLTGQNTQQIIQDKLIEKAKERLSTTSLTVNEIAYEFGFEYPQSFSKLFKSKTNLSPLEFRQSFN